MIHKSSGDTVGERMIGGFARFGAVFVGVEEDIAGAGDSSNDDLFNLIIRNIVSFDRFEGSGNMGMSESFGREGFHATFENFIFFTEIANEFMFIPFGSEDIHQTFFAFEDSFGAGIPFLRHEGGKNTGLNRHGVNGVFHHSKFSGGGASNSMIVATVDTDSIDHLVNS